ncbi:vitamin B6 transporter bsu1 [Schizosaccharomyces japonicus yFS275]|uniref:Vitamin B6 transporter bsu1 n=1 Tax=Schizosaccharomyces japonicus (strain yFS275 / FY16936) TaxID=402676 RepID=B6K2Y7_SCHJY|nr:vitamin B6 transporter bsu1 [Schizosaccharomyces japonicus yFS275]EEB07844.1 vitamin B6 transporter bsu1 [Schizosaccharomyces japonicus yFS275]
MSLSSKENEKRENEITVQEIDELFGPNHPAHPQHWSALKRWSILFVYCLLQVYVLWSSSAYGSTVSQVMEYFHISSQVAYLNMSMNILGNGLGPIFLGPLSDIGGRKPVYICALLVYILFNLACALPRNITQMVICSFICGLAGSTALTNVASSVTDMWGDKDSGVPMGLFVWTCSWLSIGGPIGAALVENPKLGWRWLYWLNMIVGGAFVFVLLCVPETLPIKVIYQYEKKQEHKLRLVPLVSFKQALRNVNFVATMGLRMMIREPIIMVLGCYNGFAYGTNYFFLNAIWPVFYDHYKMTFMGANCTYLTNIVSHGLVFFYQPVQDWLYRRDRKRNGDKSRPEAHFISALFTSTLFPAGMFLFAFTCMTHHHWIVPIIGWCMLGFANSHNWCNMLVYLSDAYPALSASAIAAFTFPSFAGATAFTHISLVMFSHMPVKWAVATLAFISLAIPPIVWIIYFFGSKIQAHSSLSGERGYKYLPVRHKN